MVLVHSLAVVRIRSLDNVAKTVSLDHARGLCLLQRFSQVLIRVLTNPAAMVAPAEPSIVLRTNVSVQQVTPAPIVRPVSLTETRSKTIDPHAPLGDPCADNPCLNGATCMSNSFGGFTCRCPQGYSGQRCEDRE